MVTHSSYIITVLHILNRESDKVYKYYYFYNSNQDIQLNKKYLPKKIPKNILYIYFKLNIHNTMVHSFYIFLKINQHML